MDNNIYLRIVIYIYGDKDNGCIAWEEKLPWYHFVSHRGSFCLENSWIINWYNKDAREKI